MASRISTWRAARARRAARLAASGSLPASARWTLGGIGLAMIGVGSYAVFKTEVEAGPTALITIGALLVLLAVMGRRLKSMELATGAVTFEDIKSQMGQVDTPDEVLEIANDAAATTPQIQRDPDIKEMSRSAYESVITNRLARLFGTARVQTEVRMGNLRADAVVTLNGKRAVIESWFGKPDAAMDGAELSRRLRPEYLEREDVAAVVVVSNMGEPGLYFLGQGSERAGRYEKKFAYVRWNSDEDNADLKKVIEDQLASA